jgi:hypothetical protein
VGLIPLQKFWGLNLTVGRNCQGSHETGAKSKSLLELSGHRQLFYVRKGGTVSEKLLALGF